MNKLFKLSGIVVAIIAFFLSSTTTAFAKNYQTNAKNFNVHMYSKNWNTLQNGNVDKNNYGVQQLHHGNEIYYAITSNPNNRDYQLYQAAIKNWNNLGVIKLVRVSVNNPNKEMILSGNAKKSTKSDQQTLAKNGATLGFETNDYWLSTSDHPTDVKHFNYMCDTKVHLTKYVNSLSFKSAMSTAEHELGHALGFSHDKTTFNNNYVIMNPFNNDHYLKLGQYEANTLRHYYAQFLN